MTQHYSNKFWDIVAQTNELAPLHDKALAEGQLHSLWVALGRVRKQIEDGLTLGQLNEWIETEQSDFSHIESGETSAGGTL